MLPIYPVLVGEIAKRGIKKTAIAKQIGVTERTLYNKLYGLAPFTWPEVCEIKNCFFPDLDQETLFRRAGDSESTT